MLRCGLAGGRESRKAQACESRVTRFGGVRVESRNNLISRGKENSAMRRYVYGCMPFSEVEQVHAGIADQAGAPRGGWARSCQAFPDATRQVVPSGAVTVIVHVPVSVDAKTSMIRPRGPMPQLRAVSPKCPVSVATIRSRSPQMLRAVCASERVTRKRRVASPVRDVLIMVRPFCSGGPARRKGDGPAVASCLQPA